MNSPKNPKITWPASWKTRSIPWMNPEMPPPRNIDPCAIACHVRPSKTRRPRARAATAGRSGFALRRVDAVGLDLAIEVAALDLQALRRPRHVPVVGAQLGDDVRALEVVARLPERSLVRLGRRRGRVLRPERSRAVVGADLVAGRHDHEPLDHVPQLAHVARPVVGQEVA